MLVIPNKTIIAQNAEILIQKLVMTNYYCQYIETITNKAGKSLLSYTEIWLFGEISFADILLNDLIGDLKEFFGSELCQVLALVYC